MYLQRRLERAESLWELFKKALKGFYARVSRVVQWFELDLHFLSLGGGGLHSVGGSKSVSS
jgi:hypothetical protein